MISSIDDGFTVFAQSIGLFWGGVTANIRTGTVFSFYTNKTPPKDCPRVSSKIGSVGFSFQFV